VTNKSEQIASKLFNSLEIVSQMGFPIMAVDGGPLWVNLPPAFGGDGGQLAPLLATDRDEI